MARRCNAGPRGRKTEHDRMQANAYQADKATDESTNDEIIIAGDGAEILEVEQ